MAKKILSTNCPCCGLAMQTVAMVCENCEVKIEGQFSQSFFDRLSREDQEFLEQYLLAGFSIKELEKTTSMGYAAIRSKLNRLIGNYEALKVKDAQKSAVLKQLRDGAISVAEAKEKLKKITGE